MCAHASPRPVELPAKATPLVDFLRERVREDGDVYIKSRYIADDVGLSSKEIGSYMKRLSEMEQGPTVEAWSYTNGTTWYVSGE